MTAQPSSAASGNATALESRERLFVGSAVARYDVDEIDALAKRPRQEKYVEVRRPDGSVAKSRGERTFYGAFTGGFSAGYWNTVGSKEGWAPASFSSSRKQRNRLAQRVEDFMDTEDLQEHHASHKTVLPQEQFTPKGAAAKGHASALPGGLPKSLEQELFPAEPSLGAKLLQAAKVPTPQGSPPESASGAAAADPQKTEPTSHPSSSSSSQAPAQGQQSEQDKARRKRYGCALPPPGYSTGGGSAPGDELPLKAAKLTSSSVPQPEAQWIGTLTGVALAAGSSSALLEGESVASGPQSIELLVEPQSNTKLKLSAAASRWQEVRLEQLWRSKIDRHGIGYGLDTASVGVPVSRRLYMSTKRGLAVRSAEGYSAFGTGVFDMDDHDAWEDLYDGDSKQQVDCDHMLKDADVEDEVRGAGVHDARMNTRMVAVAIGRVPGFVEVAEPDAELDEEAVTKWAAPKAPRGFRGMHRSDGNARAEAQVGSKEQRILLDFLEKHGSERLMKPGYRAELLGDRHREPKKPSAVAGASATAGSQGAGEGAGVTGVAGAVPEVSIVSTGNFAAGGSTGSTAPAPALDNKAAEGGSSQSSSLQQPEPLWKGSAAVSKEALLQSLGRSFVVGDNQDMDGRLARHQPFNADPKKQQRFARFCLALEGQASASGALQDDGGLPPAAREAELEEFGRVYRTFRQENRDAKLQDVFNLGHEVEVAPVMRREVSSWLPERVLCKRFGVPQPNNFSGGELPCTKRQRAYKEQVQSGLDKILAGSSAPPPEALPKDSRGVATNVAEDRALSASVAAPAPRPPKSLFNAIFGDGSIDEILDVG